MTMASVFSGIGGEMVAATMMGWDVEFFCEKNPFGHKVLSYWYPNAEKYEDITTTDFSKWRGKINVLTGGFPCQPFSYAGKRKGADDDRYLWPFMYRAIDQIQPDWIVAENVGGILTMVEQSTISRMENKDAVLAKDNGVRRYQQRGTFTLQRICRDLQKHGYSVQPVLIPACAVGAPHRRDRVFIVAHRNDVENTMRSGLFHGQHEEQGGERNFGNACSGSSERVCGEAPRVDTAHSASAGLQHGYQPGSEASQTGAVQGEGHCSKRHLHAETDGDRGFVANTNSSRRREGYDDLQPEIPNGQKPFGHGGQSASSDSFGCGEGTPRQSGSSACNGRDENQQPSQRGAEAERIDGCSPLLWDVADTSDPGAERMRQERQDEVHGRGEALRETANAKCEGLFGQDETGDSRTERLHLRGAVAGCCGQNTENVAGLGRWDSFPTVSPVHRGNDGLPFDVDNLTISFSKWRTESLKAYGNAIVPQVMYEIFRAIQEVENDNYEKML